MRKGTARRISRPVRSGLGRHAGGHLPERRITLDAEQIAHLYAADPCDPAQVVRIMSTIMAFSARSFSDAANSRARARSSSYQRPRAIVPFMGLDTIRAPLQVRKTTPATPNKSQSRAFRHKRHTAAAGRRRGSSKSFHGSLTAGCRQSERVVHLVRFTHGDSLSKFADGGGVHAGRDRRLPVALKPLDGVLSCGAGRGDGAKRNCLHGGKQAKPQERKARGFTDASARSKAGAAS